jgi:hypothetical protein
LTTQNWGVKGQTVVRYSRCDKCFSQLSANRFANGSGPVKSMAAWCQKRIDVTHCGGFRLFQ